MIREAKKDDAKACFRIFEEFLGELNCSEFEIYKKFFRAKNNRLSFENCIVYEKDSQVVAALNSYDAAWADFLDCTLIEYAKTKNKSIVKECENSGFYLDMVAVLREFRGNGYFRELLNFSLKKAKNLGHQKMGLITKTPEIYYKFGFKISGNLDYYGETYQKMSKVL